MAAWAPHVRVFGDPSAVHQAAAATVVACAARACGRRGAFHLGLSGGNTPRGLYQLLARVPWRERVDWAAVHVWFSDERCVPPDHPDSNYRMAQEALLAHVPLAEGHIHRMRGELGPTEAARLYENELRAAGGRLDLLLLGMGADGHTASLFPEAAEPDAARWVVPAIAPAEPRRRLSLTLAAMRTARRIVFLVTGADKAPAVARVLAAPPARIAGMRRSAGHERPLPAARVRAARGARPTWLLDAEAAGTWHGK